MKLIEDTSEAYRVQEGRKNTGKPRYRIISTRNRRINIIEHLSLPMIAAEEQAKTHYL
jgi:hypothetical protein